MEAAHDATLPVPCEDHDMVDSIKELRQLEGQEVRVALTNGSRIDQCEVVSVGRGQVGTLWAFVNGSDLFIPFGEIAEIRPFARTPYQQPSAA